MLHRYSMGNRRDQGHKGRLVRRLKRPQGNTWHKDWMCKSRLRDVHEAFTHDILQYRGLPFPHTGTDQTSVGPMRIEA